MYIDMDSIVDLFVGHSQASQFVHGYRPKMLEERLRRSHVRQLSAQLDRVNGCAWPSTIPQPSSSDIAPCETERSLAAANQNAEAASTPTNGISTSGKFSSEGVRNSLSRSPRKNSHALYQTNSNVSSEDESPKARKEAAGKGGGDGSNNDGNENQANKSVSKSLSINASTIHEETIPEGDEQSSSHHFLPALPVPAASSGSRGNSMSPNRTHHEDLAGFRRTGGPHPPDEDRSSPPPHAVAMAAQIAANGGALNNSPSATAIATIENHVPVAGRAGRNSALGRASVESLRIEEREPKGPPPKSSYRAMALAGGRGSSAGHDLANSGNTSDLEHSMDSTGERSIRSLNLSGTELPSISIAGRKVSSSEHPSRAEARRLEPLSISSHGTSSSQQHTPVAASSSSAPSSLLFVDPNPAQAQAPVPAQAAAPLSSEEGAA